MRAGLGPFANGPYESLPGDRTAAGLCLAGSMLDGGGVFCYNTARIGTKH